MCHVGYVERPSVYRTGTEANARPSHGCRTAVLSTKLCATTGRRVAIPRSWTNLDDRGQLRGLRPSDTYLVERAHVSCMRVGGLNNEPSKHYADMA